MNLNDWFLGTLKHPSERWKEPGWILTLFCVTELPKVNSLTDEERKNLKMFDLLLNTDDKTYCYYDSDKVDFIPLGKEVIVSLLSYKDKITLKPGDLPNIKENTPTTLGNVVINLYCSIYAFGSRFPFLTGGLSGSEFEKMVIEASSPTLPEDQRLTPAEITKWKRGVSALSALTPIAGTSGTRNSFYAKKEVIALRDKLISENRNRLDDPTVVADIEKQLLDYDKKLTAGDISETFFAQSGKLRSLGRKRQNIMYGFESRINGTTMTITNALDEGMDFELIPVYADVITSASASRGLLTAQGGELVKYNLRMFQNARITKGDCGTKRFLQILVDDNAGWLVGRRMQAGKEVVTITKDVLKQHQGKIINVRSPGFCLSKGRDFCECCVDDLLSIRTNSIAVAAAATTNVIMQDAMKAMHGRVLSTERLVLSQHLS